MLTLSKYRSKIVLPLIIGLSMITQKVSGQIYQMFNVPSKVIAKKDTLPNQDELLLRENIGNKNAYDGSIDKKDITTKFSNLYSKEWLEFIKYYKDTIKTSTSPILKIVFDKRFPAGMYNNDTVFINGIFPNSQEVKRIMRHEFFHTSNFHTQEINHKLYKTFPIDSCKKQANTKLNKFLKEKDSNTEYVPDDEDFKKIVKYMFKEEEFFVRSLVIRDYLLGDISHPGVYTIDTTTIKNLLYDKNTPGKELIIFIQGYKKKFLNYIFSLKPWPDKYGLQKTPNGRNIIVSN